MSSERVSDSYRLDNLWRLLIGDNASDERRLLFLGFGDQMPGYYQYRDEHGAWQDADTLREAIDKGLAVLPADAEDNR